MSVTDPTGYLIKAKYKLTPKKSVETATDKATTAGLGPQGILDYLKDKGLIGMINSTGLGLIYGLDPQVISAMLTKMVKDGQLERIKRHGQYQYMLVPGAPPISSKAENMKRKKQVGQMLLLSATAQTNQEDDVDSFQKAFLTRNDRAEWANNFVGFNGLYIEALKVVKGYMVLAKEEVLERKANAKPWRELEDLPRSERDSYLKARSKVREHFEERYGGLDVRRAELATKLVDAKLEEAKRFRKSEPGDSIGDWMSKASDGKSGESLGETKTEELRATLADLDHRLKSKNDPAMQARRKVIAAELGKRDGGMEKCSGGVKKSMTDVEFERELGIEDPGVYRGHAKITPKMSEETTEKSMSTDLDDWMEKSGLPTHDARMGGPKSDTQGVSQDGGDLDGKGKTPDNNGGPVDAPGIDANGGVTGVPGAKKVKLSEDDEEEGKIGSGKKPIETVTKSILPSLSSEPLTPARQRDMVAHEVAVEASQFRKGAEMVTVGPGAHPFSVAQTMDAADLDAMSKSGGSEIPSMRVSPGQSIAQREVLCKSVHLNGCGATHSAMLTACPECGAGTTVSRVMPDQARVSVVPVAGPGGLRLAKRDPLVTIQ